MKYDLPIYSRAVIIIIIIIIWHYNPLWVFVSSTKSLKVLLSVAVSFQFSTFRFFWSSMSSSCFSLSCSSYWSGFIGFQSNSFLVGLVWSILWVCPRHLILCALLNLTISAPFISLSVSMLFRFLHILSIMTGPYIFLSICLSKCVGRTVIIFWVLFNTCWETWEKFLKLVLWILHSM